MQREDLFADIAPANIDVERAAIAEFDGNVPREVAEMMSEREAFAPWPHQVRMNDHLRERLRAGVSRILAYLPTGGGKTEATGAAVKAALAKGNKVLFVCHLKELIAQTSSRFYRMNIPHGILQADNTRALYQDVIIGSIQTIDRRLATDSTVAELLDGMSVVFVDEAHACANSKAYQRLFARFAGRPIIGLTATPFPKGLSRHIDALGGPLFQELVIGASIPELIDAGYLVDCEIYAPADVEPDLAKVKVVAGDYHEGQLADAVDRPNLIGDIVSHKQLLAPGQQALVFAVNIAHSKNIVEQFRGAGVTAAHIDAYSTENERKRIIRDFKAGKIEILSNVAVLAEGFDAPTVSVMVLARPTKSLTRYIQMSGRVLRRSPGKAKALILDHSGTCRRLGFPTDVLPLELDDGKPNKRGDRKPKEKPLPKECTSCHFLKPAAVHECPKCGFAPEKRDTVEISDGELVRFDRESRRRTKFDKPTLAAELKWIAEDRGYSAGWVSRKFREAVGVWPNHYRYVAPQKPSPETLAWVKSRLIAWAKSKKNPANGAAA